MRTNNLAEKVLVQMIITEQQSEEVREESKSSELDAVAVGDAFAKSFGVVLDHISICLSTCGGRAGVFGYKSEPYDLSTGVSKEFKNKIAATKVDVATGFSCTQCLGDQLVDTSLLLNLIEKGFD